MRKGVCDCPEPCGWYVEGYAQGEVKAYFEMGNFD